MSRTIALETIETTASARARANAPGASVRRSGPATHATRRRPTHATSRTLADGRESSRCQMDSTTGAGQRNPTRRQLSAASRMGGGARSRWATTTFASR
jgi:hypothetical protein